jgi:hypothetical protein
MLLKISFWQNAMKGTSIRFERFKRAGGWCNPVAQGGENHPGAAG